MASRRVGGLDGIGEGLDGPQEGEPDSPSINLGDLTLTGKSAGLVAEPDRQDFRDCPPETVTGSRDRHHHLTARLHCCLIEGPGGAGVILWRLSIRLDRHIARASDVVVACIRIPQRTGENMASRRVGGLDGIGEGLDGPQEGEPDSPSINLGDLTLTGKSAGLVAEPDRQDFRDCPPETVTGSRDRHHHLTARLHCCLIEGPGGAGVILWRLSIRLDRHIARASDVVVACIRIPQRTGENMASRRVGGLDGIGEGLDGPQEGEPDSPSINLGDLTLTGKSAGLVAEPDRQDFRDCPPETVTGSRDRHHHLTARLHCCLIEGPGGAGVILWRRRGGGGRGGRRRYSRSPNRHIARASDVGGIPINIR